MESAAPASDLMTWMVTWLAANPGWAGFAVFLISLGESLVVVGLFIPGTLVMFGIGSLVAFGAMDLWDTLLWAIAGAIVGDGISFWIGHHYRDHLRQIWPFSRHPEWFVRAEHFFARHGGKSVVFGRFAGPVRPIIPAVAGMMGMPPFRFYVVNVVSALLWAPSYILPGVLLGASLSLAASVTTRLALLALLVLSVVWFTAWLVQRIYRFFQPRSQQMIKMLLHWSNRYPLTRHFTHGILDPNHPEMGVIIELSLLLLLAFWGFFSILAWQLYSSGPLGVDGEVYYLLQTLHSPWADTAMLLLATLGSGTTTAAVTVVGLGWLLWRRHWQGLTHWLAALALGLLSAMLVHILLPLYPPALSLDDAEHLNLTRNYLTFNILVYGFLAVLCARELPPRWRGLPYIAASIWLMMLIIAGVYLAQYWFSDILNRLTLGLIWVALLGLAYRRHADAPPLGSLQLLAVLLLTLTLVGGWQWQQQPLASGESLSRERPQFLLDEPVWWDKGWQELPAYRIDWEGDLTQPMTLQWAGELSQFSQVLEQAGWQAPPALNLASMLHWFNPAPALTDLPSLPKVHDGRHDALRLIFVFENNARLVLRLWSADTRLTGSNTPLWVGSVSREYLRHSLGILTLPSVESDFEEPLRHLQNTMPGLDARLVNDPARNGSQHPGWHGNVLLVRTAAP